MFIPARPTQTSTRLMHKKGSQKLSPQHRRFCEEYMIDGNGARSYKAVYPGTSDASARSAASGLLTKPNVRRFLTRARLRQSLDLRVTRERIVERLAALAFNDLRRLGKWNRRKGFVIRNSDDLDDDAAYAVESIKSITTTERGKRKTETEVKLSSKQGALEKLMRMHGWDGQFDDDLSEEERISRMKALMHQMDTRTSTRSKKK